MTELALAGADQQTVQLVLDLERTGALDATGLTLTDPTMQYESWESLGRFFGRIERSTNWWVGDWLIFGEAVFGEAAAQGVEATTAERYSEAERITGLSHGTLMNVRSICASIAKPRRRADLPFWLHEPVAKLEPADQEYWLEEAKQRSLTKDELRRAIKDWLSPPAEGDGGDEGAGGGDPGPSIAERQEEVLGLIVRTAQPTSDGNYVVSGEIMAQARAALGED